ncbi:Major facilitator superfamily domain-containing protein 1, partial [Dictyocoela roeselum]
KIRDTLSLRLLTFIVFAGQVVFTTGVCYEKFYLMVLGRFLFGVGSESYTVIQNKIVGNTFRDGELSTAMSFLVASGRMGTIANFILTPWLSETKVLYSCLVALIFTFCGFLLSFLVEQKQNLKLKIVREENIGIENDEINEHERVQNPLFIISEKCSPWGNFFGSNEENEDGNNPDFLLNHSNEAKNPFETLIVNSPRCLQEDGFYSKLPGTFCGFETELPNKNFFYEDFSDNEPVDGDSKDKNKTILNEKSCKAEKLITHINETNQNLPTLYKKENQIHPSFIILASMGFLFACVWSPFYNIGTLIFQKRYSLSNLESGHIMSLIEFISIFMVVVSGKLVDCLGSRIFFIATGGILLLFSHIFIIIRVNHIMIAIILGLAGPLIATYWACAVYLSSPESLGKSFAILYTVINFSYTFSPLILSYLVKIDETYTHVEIYLISVTIGAMFFVCLLNFCNKKYNLGLNKKSGILMNSPEMV